MEDLDNFETETCDQLLAFYKDVMHFLKSYRKMRPSSKYICNELVSGFPKLNSVHFNPFWDYVVVSITIYKQVVLEPRVSPEHRSKYVDTVTFFAKTWTKGHWSLDDLWPHICSGLMCDSTQGSLCPSLMKIHQSMWIQWPFLQKLEAKVIDP